MMLYKNVLYSFLLAFIIQSIAFGQELNGDWSLQLETGTPAWMSIRNIENEPKVKFRLYVGPNGPQKNVQYKDGRLIFELRQNKNATDTKTVNVGIEEGKLDGVITSTTNDGKTTRDAFTGKKVPPMPTAAPDLAKVRFGHPILLFNGKDLAGWRPHESDKINGWSAKDGLLVNTTPKTDFSATGAYANLRTENAYTDFCLHIEFLVEKKRNSGISFHRYLPMLH